MLFQSADTLPVVFFFEGHHMAPLQPQVPSAFSLDKEAYNKSVGSNVKAMCSVVWMYSRPVVWQCV